MRKSRGGGGHGRAHTAAALKAARGRLRAAGFTAEDMRTHGVCPADLIGFLICPNCGAELTDHGVCPACGWSDADGDEDGLEVRS